jgi:hypothetical protein
MNLSLTDMFNLQGHSGSWNHGMALIVKIANFLGKYFGNFIDLILVSEPKIMDIRFLTGRPFWGII